MAENPIPGNPAELYELARSLKSGWSTLRDLRSQTSALQQPNDGWDSDAAVAFRDEAGDLPTKLGQAEARFWGTHWALNEYARELEEAQRAAGPAMNDLGPAQRKRKDLEDDWVRLRATEPGSEEAGQAKRRWEDALEDVRSLQGTISRAREKVDEAARTCSERINATIADPLRDDRLPDLKAIGLGLANFVTDNPWVAVAGAIPGVGPLVVTAFGLANSEPGFEALEVASDVLNIVALVAGVVTLFAPNPFTAAIGAGASALGLIADVALYSKGRKSELDLALDVVGIATLGIGKVTKLVGPGRSIIDGVKDIGGTYALIQRVARAGGQGMRLAQRMYRQAVYAVGNEVAGALVDIGQGAEALYNRIRNRPEILRNPLHPTPLAGLPGFPG
jgi:hypothetical protein